MKIIGITGYKQSGKDTVAELLAKQYLPKRTVRLGFADALKQEVCSAFRISREYLEQNKKNFRLILQGVGTDYRRVLCGEDYWVLKWMQAANALVPIPDILICSDVRFHNEANTIKQLGGVLIRVNRPGVFTDGHASETEQTSILTDFTVHNDGTVADLQQKLKQIKL